MDLKKYNPEGSLLRRDQLELLRMLQCFGKILDDLGVQWWLASGTLLGAARHRGFIPWDDDIDIVMFHKDYKKIEKALCNLESDEFVFHCMRTDPDYVNSFGKFRKKEGRISVSSRRYDYYKWAGIGLDLFTIEKTNYLSVSLARTVYKHMQPHTAKIRKNWMRIPLIRTIELFNFCLIHPICRLIGLINPKKEYHYSMATGWNKVAFTKEMILPLGKIDFEGVQFPAPRDVDAYLTREYGDWRKLPSEESIKKSIHCIDYRKEIFGNGQYS